ncbi:hypothetical protein, partial [Schaedlerella arabinosiphila]|uniref:hypothetical protein n=1 Tax=Schaedlerella arabinosiphila TaxID=2044587 RepID=UPI002F402FEE
SCRLAVHFYCNPLYTEAMVILLIEKVIDNKMFPKSTAGLYISDSYQRNFISHRHRIFYGLPPAKTGGFRLAAETA